MTAVWAWFAAHPVIQGVLYMVLLAIVGSAINWVTYKRTPQAWALYELAYPRRAAVIRFCRAVFPHLRKVPALAPFFAAADQQAAETKDGDK